VALGVVLYCLAKHPAIQQQCVDEIVRVCGLEELHGKPDEVEQFNAPSYQQQKQFEFLERCMNEAVRVYPPISVLPFRITTAECKLGDLTLPKGQIVQVDIGLIHRDKKIWGEDAEEFKPERQTSLTPEQRRATMPFGSGARQCIGQHFSVIEQRVLLAGILLRYRVELPKGFDEARDLKFKNTSLVKPDLILTPRNGNLHAA